MRRPWQPWLAFVACCGVLIGTLAWLTRKAVELDRAEAVARQQAVLEESSRLALWRMDTAMATLVARESAQPGNAYASFLPVATWTPPTVGDRSREVLPSPLLASSPPALLNFEFAADGTLSSPQVPKGGERKLAVRFLSAEAIAKSEKLLERLRGVVAPVTLAERLPEFPHLPPPDPVVLNYGNTYNSNAQVSQNDRNNSDYQVRRQLIEQNSLSQIQQRDNAPLQNGVLLGNFNGRNSVQSPLPIELGSSVMTPVWFGEELFLARRWNSDGQQRLQGCWLDWPAIRADLLARIQDLLPGASLVPAAANELPGLSPLMATLPVRLAPGVLQVAPPEGLSPLELSLAIAWCGLASMIAVAGVLMRGVLALSERRAAFVSAVTHELRTPLTTFRMYAEMLAEDMVPAETDRKSYLQTLRSESDRLIHLVENVLAYARLERGSAAGRRTSMTVAELLAAVEKRLNERSIQCGMDLTLSANGLEETAVETDPSAVEQILFNLVDNACKYGVSELRAIRVEASLHADRVHLTVRDFGPGIPGAAARKLFRPFHKSAHEAAVSAPGVGLGLALCRRLARDLGGDLRCETPDGAGACFVLELPLAARSQ